MLIEEYMIWIWLAIFVLAVFVEATTQDFVSIWFAAGALIAMIISYPLPFWGEIIVFAVVSLASLIGTRPLVKRLMDRTTRKTNADEFVGKRVKTITNIDKFDGGEVKLNGVVYTAILMEEETKTIERDSIVEVVALRGNRVVVKMIEETKEEE